MSFLSRQPHRTSNSALTPQIPWQSYFRPLWWVSLGLHLLLLRIPLPVKQPPPKIVKSVKITKLTPVSKAKSEVSPKPTLALKPKPIPQTVSAVPVQVPRRMANTKLSQPQPTPQSTLQPTPTPEQKIPPNRRDKKVLKDFPQYPDAITGCDEYCFQTQASLEEVATYFEKKLSDQQWKLKLLPNKDTDRKIYQVEKGGLTQFLSILMAQPTGTIYVLADQERNLEDIKQTQESVAMISSILAEVKDIEAVDRSSTAQPKLFERESDIVSQNLIQRMKPDEVWTTYFERAFTKDSFEVSRTSNPYGGGPVYEVQRASFTGYLNLVPSEDGNGTVVVLWKVPPN
jgi:hypothetical protein